MVDMRIAGQMIVAVAEIDKGATGDQMSQKQ